MPDLLYKRNEKPKSKKDWILYSFQWVVTMFYAVVWGYALVGLGLELEGQEMMNYMSAIVLTIGISTLIQALAGHKMAMVSGPNIIILLAIVAAYSAGGKEYAQQAFLAQAISGIVIGIIALLGLIKYIKKIWSPLILGAMVMMVGLAVADTGIQYIVQGNWDFSSLVGFLLAFGGIFLAIKGKGVWGSLSLLLIIGVGFLSFILMGDIDYSYVNETSLIITPKFLPYGFQVPPIDLLVIIFLVNLMAVLNLYGNLHGYATIINEEVPATRQKKTFTIFGFLETIVPGILGAPATIAFGENLGIVKLTKVASRYFIIVAAVIFSLLAFLGPFVGLMASIPKPIAGAVLLGMASNVIGIGADTFHNAPKYGRREQIIVGFSIFLSLGLSLLPDDTWDKAPRYISTLFSNPVISVILFVILLEQIVFRKKTKNPNSKKEETDQKQNNV